MSKENQLNLQMFFAQKAGMTRIFDQNGNHVPVTVLKLIPNVVCQVKSKEKDGYSAYQIGFYQKREKLISKPVKGHLTKSNVEENLARFAEIKSENADVATLGQKLGYTQFSNDQLIDVTGISKGKGFQGVIKRYNFSGGPAAHGSKFHRRTGSIGNRATPARVFPEKKMPGHMGDEKVTVQNIKIVEINEAQGYMLVKGSIPGSKNGFVTVRKAIKSKE